MFEQILKFIVLPNVGYLKSKKLVKKELLNCTIQILTKKKEHTDCVVYLLDGMLHRKDGPAITHNWKADTSDSIEEWYILGKLHRKGDLPAIIWETGRKEWYKNGKLHRKGDLPAVIWETGTEEWWKRGKMHRKKGPSFKCLSGYKEWWIHGKKIEKKKNRTSKHGRNTGW